MKAPPRKCPVCGKLLKRRPGEGAAKFQGRKYDSPLCASKASGWRGWRVA